MHVSVVSADRYYKGLPKGCDPDLYDFDDPAALEWSLLASHLKELEAGHDVEVRCCSMTSIMSSLSMNCPRCVACIGAELLIPHPHKTRDNDDDPQV